MRPVRDLQTGEVTDITDRFKSSIDDVVYCLAHARRLADRDCPYEAEHMADNAKRYLREVCTIAKRAADCYERTAYGDSAPATPAADCGVEVAR